MLISSGDLMPPAPACHQSVQSVLLPPHTSSQTASAAVRDIPTRIDSHRVGLPTLRLTPLEELLFHLRCHRIEAVERSPLREHQADVVLPIFVELDLFDNIRDHRAWDYDDAVLVAQHDVARTDQYPGATNRYVVVHIKHGAAGRGASTAEDGDVLFRHVR